MNVEILALLDRSGSMSTIMEEAVGAFNSFIETQKLENKDNKVFVTLAAFDDKYEVVFNRININKLKELKVDMVRSRGMTSLNDAIGNIITSAKYPKRPTILLIQTDGHENSSKEYTSEMVKKLISEKEEDGWDVNFIGAGLDQQSVTQMAFERGIDPTKVLSVTKNTTGMDDLTTFYSNATSSYIKKVSGNKDV